MSLNELFPVVRSLGHADKLRLLQFLAGELAEEGGAGGLRPGVTYPLWSAFDASEAAASLQKMLEEGED